MSAIGLEHRGDPGRLDRGLVTYAAPLSDRIGLALVDDGLVAKAAAVHLAVGRSGRSACGMLYPGRTTRRPTAVSCARCMTSHQHAGMTSRAAQVGQRAGPFGKAMPLRHKIAIGAGTAALAGGTLAAVRVKRRGRMNPEQQDQFANWMYNSSEGRSWYKNPERNGRYVDPKPAGPGKWSVGKIDTTMSPAEAKRHVAAHGAVGPLPKTMPREQRMKVYEARYVHAGGPKGEGWQRRADAADKVTVGALATGGASALTELAARVRHSHRLSQVAATGGLLSAGVGAGSELTRRYAERRRSSHTNAPAGVAASALRRMRAYDAAGKPQS